jgi:hypothetical protein
MIKPPMSNIPGMNAMTDTLGFVKNLWGGMGVPGMVMPTLSVDEINKQISDLKAVESWLNLNMNMLRGTIQALEVQAATISTLQTMGETLAAAAKSGAAPKPKSAAAKPAPEAAPAKPEPAAAAKPETPPNPFAGKMAAPQANPAAWWNMLQDQFKQAVSSAMSTDTGKRPTDGAASKAAAGGAKRPASPRKPAATKGNAKGA